MQQSSLTGINSVQRTSKSLTADQALVTLCAENRNDLDDWTDAIMKFRFC